MIPFKLIPRPAGLHPVTLSCSSGLCAVPHPGKHIGGDLLYFSFLPFSLRGVRYFHPRIFHSPSTAIPPLLLILLSSTLSQPFSYCRLQQPATAYWDSFLLSLRLLLFYASISCPFSACNLGMRPLHISYSHFYSLSLSPLHFLLMTSLSHLTSPPLFSLFSPFLAIFVLPPRHMFSFSPSLPPT